MLTSGGKRVSWDVAADATTNNNPPITSTFGFYVTLTAELADDISLRHIILFFNFIKFTNPNPNSPCQDPANAGRGAGKWTIVLPTGLLVLLLLVGMYHLL